MDLPGRVAEFLAAHGVSGPIVVGVSGGPDSTALLRALAAAGADVHAAHLHHGLRDAAAGDAEFVAGLAAELGLPVDIGQVDTRAEHAARRGGSLENTARILRRRFLERVADEAGARWIALAHTADDQAETVLMHLLRGAGPAGLAGMRPVDGRYVRPLLEARRAEGLAYLADHGWPYRIDETNEDLSLRRNRVRHELLPALAAYNPRIVDALGRTAHLMRLVDEWAGAEVDARTPAGATIDAERLAGAPRYLALALARRVAGLELSLEHAAAVADLATAPDGSAVDLPGGLVARRVGSEVRIGPPPSASMAPGPAEVTVPSTVQWGEAELVFDAEAPGDVVATGPREAYMDADRIRPPLTVRSRRPGDRFHPLGAPGAQKLKQFFADHHVPRHERDTVPLLVDADGVVCVVGHRIAERVKVRATTTRYLHVRLPHAQKTGGYEGAATESENTSS